MPWHGHEAMREHPASQKTPASTLPPLNFTVAPPKTSQVYTSLTEIHLALGCLSSVKPPEAPETQTIVSL